MPHPGLGDGGGLVAAALPLRSLARPRSSSRDRRRALPVFAAIATGLVTPRGGLFQDYARDRRSPSCAATPTRELYAGPRAAGREDRASSPASSRRRPATGSSTSRRRRARLPGEESGARSAPRSTGRPRAATRSRSSSRRRARTHLPRGRGSVRSGGDADRRDHRREAEDGARQRWATLRSGSRSRSSAACSSPARSPGTSRGGSPSRCSRSRGRRTRSPRELRRRGATCPAPARSATCRSGSTQMAERLAETEELERNFLMSVSHELRTPLTAIRGHVEALREGVVEDPELAADSLEVVAPRRGGSSGSSATCSTWRSSTRTGSRCCARRSTWRRLVDRAYATFGEEARRRAIDYAQTSGRSR